MLLKVFWGSCTQRWPWDPWRRTGPVSWSCACWTRPRCGKVRCHDDDDDDDDGDDDDDDDDGGDDDDGVVVIEVVVMITKRWWCWSWLIMSLVMSTTMMMMIAGARIQTRQLFLTGLFMNPRFKREFAIIYTKVWTYRLWLPGVDQLCYLVYKLLSNINLLLGSLIDNIVIGYDAK